MDANVNGGIAVRLHQRMAIANRGAFSWDGPGRRENGALGTVLWTAGTTRYFRDFDPTVGRE